MKKLMYIFAFPLLLAAFVGCDKKNEEPEPDPGLPFTEYLSQNVERYWKRMPQNDDDYAPKGIIVNSAEELEPYKNPNYEGEYPPIDFSKHTLLLVYGTAGASIGEMVIHRLDQLSPDQYKVNIEISLGIHAVMQPWIITVLIDKLNDENDVQPDVQYIQKPLEP